MQVVVIDDGPLVRFAVYQALRENGIAVTSTDSALAFDAIDDLIAADAAPDVIVVDRQVRSIDGVDVVERCCARSALARVGFVLLRDDDVSWMGDDEAFGAMLARCAVPPRTVTLTKPFRASELRACVREVTRS